MIKKTLKETEAQVREALAKMQSAHEKGGEGFEAAKREYDLLSDAYNLAIQEEAARRLPVNANCAKERLMREVVKNVKSGANGDFVMQREITSSIINTGDLNNMESAGFPVTVKDLLEPLEVETVYDKVGINIETGAVGQLQWPCLDTTAEVDIVGETVELDDTGLDFSKIIPVQKRMGISIRVSNEALENASFDLYATVTKQMSAALKRVLNKAVVSAEAVGQLAGPFASDSSLLNSMTFAGEWPTYAELLQMKGIVAGTGADMAGFCYLMNTLTCATLEATSKTESNGGMIIENGKLGGYPVFVTDSAKIADGCVNAGSFKYASLIQHGDAHFIIDPYTAAKKNEIVFTFNANWSLTTLKPQAFCVGAKA